MLLKGNHFCLITNKISVDYISYRYFWWNQYRTSVHVKKNISVHLYTASLQCLVVTEDCRMTAYKSSWTSYRVIEFVYETASKWPHWLKQPRLSVIQACNYIIYVFVSIVHRSFWMSNSYLLWKENNCFGMHIHIVICYNKLLIVW